MPNRAEAQEAERRLSELGFQTGPIDGVIDGTTRIGLIAFQKWENEIKRGLERFGMTTDDAELVATTILSQLEGALLLARTGH